MTVPDPSDRRLRGALSAAVRNGQTELEAEMRRELSLRNIERCVRQQLNGQPLSAMELRRLRLVLEDHGPQRQPVEPAEPDAVAV